MKCGAQQAKYAKPPTRCEMLRDGKRCNLPAVHKISDYYGVGEHAWVCRECLPKVSPF